MRRAERLVAWGLAYAPSAALLVLLPKCPLCIAAPLALIGVGVALPSGTRAAIVAASVLLGTAVGLALAGMGKAAAGARRARPRLRCGSCALRDGAPGP